MPTCNRPVAKMATTPNMASTIIQRNMRDSISGRSVVVSAITFLNSLQNLEDLD